MLQRKKEKEFFENLNEYEGYDDETFKTMLQYSGKIGRVIEIGCASGSWTRRLRKVADEVIGIDFSRGLIKTMHINLKNNNSK